MPSMTIKDFGDTPPRNATDIIQAVNNLILYREESDFWSDKPDEMDQWERDLIERCATDDRSGELQIVPRPIF